MTGVKRALVALVLLSSGLSLQVQAEEPVSKSFFGGVAIGGYDTVAYHQNRGDAHRAIKGSRRFTVEWKGATWRFASRENQAAFRADPARYAPAYNGFCANALSLGNGLVKTDGTHWQIYDGQLFLFYSKEGRQRWLDGDYREYKKAADLAWQEILTESGE